VLELVEITFLVLHSIARLNVINFKALTVLSEADQGVTEVVRLWDRIVVLLAQDVIFKHEALCIELGRPRMIFYSARERLDEALLLYWFTLACQLLLEKIACCGESPSSIWQLNTLCQFYYFLRGA